VNRNVAMVVILGVVVICSLIALSPWIIEGPRRWARSLLKRKDNGMMRAIGNGRKHG
jgi:uncharacterized membrane protein